MAVTQPRIIVVSAPSGAGKTTLIKEAQKIVPNIAFSISHTTRNPRAGEQNGRDYFFVSVSEFQNKIQEEDFVEWAEVHGNYYGTSKSQIEELVEQGNIVILDIDVQGAMQIKEKSDIDATFLFIEPPSLEELKSRLINRGTESEATLKKRLANAEIELGFKAQYDHVIVNDILNKAVRDFLAIVDN